MVNITPLYNLIPAKEKIQVPEIDYQMGTQLGGAVLASDARYWGSGENVGVMDKNGLYIGSTDYSVAPFRVNMAGELVASSATITGSIIASSGEIGGWAINATSIYTGTEDHSGYTANPGDMTLYSSGEDASIHAKNFYIDTAGDLYCQHANIGDPVNYINYDGSTLESNRLKLIETYTAGENLTIGSVVCLKPGYTDYEITHDSYVNVSDGNNYGSLNRMVLGRDGSSNRLKAFVKADISGISSKIVKALLYFKVWDNDATVSLSAVRVLADWDESTIVGTNDPSVSYDYVSGNVSIPSTASEIWKSIDVTDIARAWARSGINNYGLRFEGEPGGAGQELRIFSSENAGSEPYLRVYSWDDCDGKVYKYDDTNEITSQNVLGIVMATANADESVKIQIGGVYTEYSGLTIGATYFASNGSPNIADSALNLVHPTRIGEAIAADKLLMNIQENQIIEGGQIEKVLQKPSVYNETAKSTTSFYVPENATRATIYYFNDASNARYQIQIERGTMNSVNPTIYDLGGAAYEDSTTFDWSGETITITFDDGLSGPRYIKAYFYR